VISKPIKIDVSNCFPHKIEAVICWVQGGSYGFALWEVKMLCVQVMVVTLVKLRDNLKP
jgi:hypothetical protein